MQNFSMIRPAVRQPFQKNSWGLNHLSPPIRARVKGEADSRREKEETYGTSDRVRACWRVEEDRGRTEVKSEMKGPKERETTLGAVVLPPHQPAKQH